MPVADRHASTRGVCFLFARSLTHALVRLTVVQNTALREQFAALKVLFDAELARRREAAREQPSPGHGSSATELLTPSRPVYADVKGGKPASLDNRESFAEAAARSVAEDTASLRNDVAMLRGERDGLLRNAEKAQTVLQSLSSELAEWKNYAQQLQMEAAHCADAARTARAEAAALRTLLIARNSGGYSGGVMMGGDTFQLLPGARGSPAKPARPPEAEELSRFTAMAVGRK